MKRLAATFIAMGVCVSSYAADLKNLDFLSGCWKAAVEGSIIEERWSNSDGGVMLGTAKTLDNTKLTEFEFLKISQQGGNLVYFPYINGKEAVSFPLKDLDTKSQRVLFENKSNDFPQKIQYQRTRDKLNISLTGVGENKKEKKFIYTLNRIICAKGL